MQNSSQALYINRTLQNGEVIDAKQTVVVMGDVKPGCVITSSGDIVVLGRLLGSAHAGCDGDCHAVVSATDFQPSYLQVAGVTAPASLLTLRRRKHPQLAFQSQATKEIMIALVARPYLAFGPSGNDLRESAASEKRTRAAFSAIVTAGYAMAAGLLLMLFPISAFSLLFDTSLVSKGFIRLGGALLALFGAYYLGAAWGQRRDMDVRGFYWATVWGRGALSALCACLYAAGELPLGVLYFAFMNLAGAVSMKLALDKDRLAADEL